MPEARVPTHFPGPPGGAADTGHRDVSSALLTDHYELTMLQAALADGTAARRCLFEVFARRLPEGRRYGVLAGTTRLLEELARFRFGAAEIDALARTRVVDDATLSWLRDYRFSGDVWGYPEGECYLPGSPVLVVEAGFAEGVLLETLVLSVLNHDSAIAAAASRMVQAAAGRPCIEMGSRRVHEQAAVAAARAAYLAGFASTSNLAAGARYGVPTQGTSAHSFTLLHDDERSAFRAQVDALGAGTTLLVDTYDVEAAVRTAVEVAGPGLGAVRLDSGDLLAQAWSVRAQLDDLGARDTRIVVTSDLDEHAIAALAVAPVSAYGVGTAVTTGSGAPTAGLVYKLVARADDADPGPQDWTPVAKTSTDKVGTGGRKHPYRELDASGTAVAEVIGIDAPPPVGTTGSRALLHPLVRGGAVVADPAVAGDLEAARARHRSSVAELPAAAAAMSRGEPVIPTRYVPSGASPDPTRATTRDEETR